jgi:hypothetical protein
MNTHQECSQNLIDSLEELVRLYRGLLDNVRREKDILVSSNIDELNENNRAKEVILLKIRGVEEKRLELAVALAKALNLDSSAPRLQELARHTGGEAGDRFRNFHSVLELLLKRIQELNKDNESLVQSALQHVTGAMKAIRETLQDKPTYQRGGEVNSGAAPTGQLVRREA